MLKGDRQTADQSEMSYDISAVLLSKNSEDDGTLTCVFQVDFSDIIHPLALRLCTASVLVAIHALRAGISPLCARRAPCSR